MPSTAKASNEVVEKVTVSITSSQTPPSRIAKRMSASVGTVGEQMLVGRNVSDVAGGQADYERLIQEIFNRVLVGYSVKNVHVAAAPNAVIQVELSPWGDVVREVALEVDGGNLSPELTDLVKKDIGNMEDQINEILVGLPIDAVDWAGGVSKIVIREVLASKLPEFSANFEIIPGARTVVKVSLTPLGATVQDIHVSLRSRTIPNVLLVAIRPTVNQAGVSLVGLPVAFVERHRDYFTAKLTAAAEQHSLTKKYGLTLTPIIHPSVDTEIALDAETNRYKLSLEGNMDMGRSQDSTSFKLHGGKFISKQDEVFMEVRFVPSTVAWDFIPGFGHSVSKGLTVGVKYNLSDRNSILWLQQDLNRNLSLRFERTPASGLNEFGIRYKVHDFLSAEYIVNQRDQWFRLISSL